MEVAFEAADRCWELPAQDHGAWHADIGRPRGDAALAAAEGTVPAGPLDRDTLAATLGEAADAVRAELARFEALVPAVIDEFARRALGRTAAVDEPAAARSYAITGGGRADACSGARDRCP